MLSSREERYFLWDHYSVEVFACRFVVFDMDTSLSHEDIDLASSDEGSAAASEPVVDIEAEVDLLSPESPIHPAYQSLADDDIRLLKILPGEEDTKICCYVGEFAISAAPEYTALSYTWGSPYGVHEIFINGSSFRVPKNLWRFLRQARTLRGDLSGWFWVDMLSINQRDLSERGHQVKLISKIFATARRVLVWLGPAYQGSDIAMLALAKLDKNRQKGKSHARLWRGDVGHAMLGICSRPYWRRLWVFQELRLAREARLMCGDKTVEWHQIDAAMGYADSGLDRVRHANTIEAATSTPALKMARLRLQSVDTTLWSLVRLTSHLRCVDVRDKVYALLGVATGGHGSIEPDYTLPIPTLMNQLLREIYRLSPPSTFGEAVQRSEEVEDVLNVRRGTIFTIPGQRGAYATPFETELRSCKLGPPRTSVNLWWTAFYGHQSVQELLLVSWKRCYFSADGSFYGHRPDRKTALAARKLFHVCMIIRHLGLPTVCQGIGMSENHFETVEKDLFKREEPPLQSMDVPYMRWFQNLLLGRVYDSRERRSIIQALFSPGGYLACQNSQLTALMLQYAIKFDDWKLLQELLKIRGLLNVNDMRTDGKFLVDEDLSSSERVPFITWSANHPEAQAMLEMPLLSYAADKGKTSCVKALLSVGNCDVDATNTKGWTPIMHAANFGHRDCVELLLGSGSCDINVCSRDGWTPMICAASHGFHDIVGALLDSGKFDVTRLDPQHRTQILRSVYYGEARAVETLLQIQGCDVNAADNQGWLPLTLAVSRAAHSDGDLEIVHSYCKIVELLLNSPSCDVNARGRHERSALHIAAAKGSYEMVSDLVNVPGCEAGLTSHEGQTARGIALHDRRMDIVRAIDNAVAASKRAPHVDSRQAKRGGGMRQEHARTNKVPNATFWYDRPRGSTWSHNAMGNI